MKKEYTNYFKDTYKESFVLTASKLKAVLKDVNSDICVELYTNANFWGEPFAKADFYYYSFGDRLSGSISFDLIKTTDVYVKIIQE